jgi:hypothetical protein
MNNIECTFKLAYTCNVITKVIDVNISPYDLKNIITPNVNSQMGLTEFKIIIAGTDLGEDNVDLDCNISDVNISSLVGTIHNNHIPFYIKPLYSNEFGSNSNTSSGSSGGGSSGGSSGGGSSGGSSSGSSGGGYNYIINDFIINNIINDINNDSAGVSNNSIGVSNNSIGASQNSSGTNNHDESESDCPICYTSFDSLQTVRFGCNHTFCRSCTANWFRTGTVSCPLCRS